MRALRPMTQEERDFAEQHHNLVIDFLRYRRLPMDEFYDAHDLSDCGYKP